MADKNLNSITFPGLPDKYKVAQVADEYSSSSTYAVGDIVNYLGTTYRCTTAITTAENWTVGHWTPVKIAEEVTDLKSAVIDSNVVNPTRVENYYVKYSNGSLQNVSSYAYLEATGIGVYEALHVHTNCPDGDAAICFYKANGDHISSIKTKVSESPYLFDAVVLIPDEADMIRVSCLKASINNASVDTTVREYLGALKGTINGKTIENENKLYETLENIDECAISIFFKTNLGYLGGNGAINPPTANEEIYTDFIPVSKGEILTIDHATNTSGASMWLCLCLYDDEQTIIGSRVDLVSSVVRPTYKTSYTIPNGISFIRFTYRTFGTATLKLSKNWTTLNEKIKDATSGIVEINTQWETGYINLEGGEVATSTYIRSDFIDLSNIGWITFSPVTGYRFCTRWYDENQDYLPYHVGNDEYDLSTTNREFDLVNDDAKYLRIVIGSTSSTNPTTADGDKAGEVAYSLSTGNVKSLNNAVQIGIGNKIYNGEKIVLDNTNQASYKCNITKWFDFTSGNTPNIASYYLHLNQSMDIFNDYVFLISDGAPTVILDYNTKQIIGTATMPQQSNSHYNSAQFSDIYYDDDDEFPLLFTAQCNFNANDACLIYRVTRSGTSFTFTFVNSIMINRQPSYQLSWAIDNFSRKVVCTGYYNGSYNVEEDNPVVTYAWDIPSKAEILSGTQILLEPSECKSYSIIEHGTIQDIHCYNNKLFMGYQPISGGRCVYVLDIEQNRVTSRLSMIDSVRELEGMCIYDGKMFVVQKNGVDTSGNNPLTLWQVDF